MSDTLTVLSGAGFLAGLLAGMATLVAGWLWALVRSAPRPRPHGGVLIAAFVLVALAFTEDVPLSLVAGLALLGVAGVVPVPGPLRVLLSLPGAALVTRGETGWTPWLVVVAIALAVPLVASFDRNALARRYGIPLFGIAALGLFFTVPDTEIPAVLLGAMVVGAFVGWPKPFFVLGAPGAAVLTGLFAHVALAGAVGRPAALLPALACLGLLLVAPLVLVVGGTGGILPVRHDGLWLLSGQLALVTVLSRLVDAQRGTTAAALLTGLVLAAAGTLLTLSVRTGPTPRADAPDVEGSLPR